MNPEKRGPGRPPKAPPTPMRCPECESPRFQTIDTRPVEKGIRRRKQCLNCKARFTTYERARGDLTVDEEDLTVAERKAARAVIELLRLQRST